MLAFLGIALWQRGNSFAFLRSIFAMENLVNDLLLGFVVGIVATVTVVSLVKVTKTKLPKNPYTEHLKDIMLRPYGPIVIGVLPGVFEELLFRGFVLPLALDFMDEIWAVLISSLLFTALHIPQYRNKWIVNLSVLMLSIVLSYVFIYTNTLWAPMITHTVYNYFVTVLAQKGFIGFENKES